MCVLCVLHACVRVCTYDTLCIYGFRVTADAMICMQLQTIISPCSQYLLGVVSQRSSATLME